MASTNKTTHYELSQYIGTDKPTYLVDYNGDMSKIDTGIYNAQGKADTNESAIGTLSSLNTTVKTDLVSAINEVKGTADKIGNLSNLTTTANTDIVSAINEVDSDATTNTQAIGTLANLETTVKTNLVGAINELKQVNDTQDANIANFNLTSFETITSGSVVDGTGSISSLNITIAKNSDGSLAKIYGDIDTNDYVGSISISSSLRPTSNITINNVAFRYRPDNNTMGFQPITISTDGTITIQVNSLSSTKTQLIPVLIFVKDFGDVPAPIV